MSSAVVTHKLSHKHADVIPGKWASAAKLEVYPYPYLSDIKDDASAGWVHADS